MEGREGTGLDGALMKRRRSSSAARRPRPEGGPAAAEQRENTSPSSSSRSGSRRAPSEDGGLRRREFHLNDPSPEPAAEGGLRSSSKAKGSLGSSTGDKSMKVTLKIRKPNPDASDSRPPRPGDSRLRQKHDDQGEGGKDSGRSTSLQDKKVQKEKSIETLAREHPANVQRELSSDPVRKSRRLAKKPILDSELHEDYDTNVENLGTSEDTEDHILEPKSKGGRSSKKKALKKAKSKSKVYEISNDFGASRSNKDGKKRSRESFDGDDSEEEPTSDSELDAENKKEESPGNVRSGALTTRRRALQSWMDGSSNSTVEFPDGLPPAPSRGGKKEKLSEEEMLAKKAEAAQRRKMQVEKATKESEAEAIRKILGLDSDKKKEERKLKEREEKERAAREQDLAASTIRWVMGPTGTTVSFPHAIGLPSIFNSKPHSYPPPREKCAGPSCTNAYRYRDSKLNLPLCSLKCYKAVNGNA